MLEQTSHILPHKHDITPHRKNILHAHFFGYVATPFAVLALVAVVLQIFLSRELAEAVGQRHVSQGHPVAWDRQIQIVEHVERIRIVLTITAMGDRDQLAPEYVRDNAGFPCERVVPPPRGSLLEGFAWGRVVFGITKIPVPTVSVDRSGPPDRGARRTRRHGR